MHKISILTATLLISVSSGVVQAESNFTLGAGVGVFLAARDVRAAFFDYQKKTVTTGYDASGRNHGVIVTPVSNPSGLSNRVTVCPQGSIRLAMSNW